MPRRIDPHDVFSGWSEIAQALMVAERTARRFEQTEGLIVRRVATGTRLRGSGAAKGRVYATGRMLLDFIEQGGRHAASAHRR